MMKNRQTRSLIILILVNPNETDSSVQKTVYSSEYGNSDYWPYVVATYSTSIALNQTSAEVNMGGNVQLSLTEGTAASWTSSNTSVATVNSDGLVTGVRAGAATITVTNPDGITASCTVTVKFQSNTYRLTNLSTSLRMGTESISIADGVRVTGQYLNSSSPAVYGQLWQIEYAGNGYYTLRPSFNSDKYLMLFGGALIAVDASTTNAIQWKIYYDGSGYVLQNRLYGYYLYMASGATADSYVGYSTSSGSSTARWNIVTGTASHQLLMFDSETGARLNPSQTVYLNMGIGISVVCAPFNTHSGTISLSAGELATYSAATKNINGAKCGETTATLSDSCGASALSFTMRVILPLSGSELTYDTTVWDAQDVEPNCYAYAINTILDPRDTSKKCGMLNIGDIADGDEGSGIQGSEMTTTGIIAHIDGDEAKIQELGYAYSITPIGETARCPANTYKVALFIAPGQDYHWYRQNADGSWSHKVADQDVRNTDASDERIWNPLDADHDYRNTYDLPGENYTTFVGFFAVDPLDLIPE